MTAQELVERARKALPQNLFDVGSTLAWRGRIHAVRHQLKEGSRPAAITDAILELTSSFLELAEGTNTNPAIVQDHFWRYGQLKGNSVEETLEATDQILKRLLPLDSTQERQYLGDLFGIILAAEFELLAAAI
jgi:hypothetical protein